MRFQKFRPPSNSIRLLTCSRARDPNRANDGSLLIAFPFEFILLSALAFLRSRIEP
ncbi:hypothetical protein SCHPADRAFT_911967 [Schizopora paradoxa]|uniref:Uncharacterized protein n=1 Tax=Schizopora paradoxa TaxID=27342 RepID=A0A0H2RFW0_9AGAM|nr:hypothetical protein SCHPADRAFT_911967 [Schizopora paradoxa]